MKFCPTCDTKLTRDTEDVGGPMICPKCNPEKIIPRKPTYGVNYSGRTRSCSKCCGAEIYWDEEFKSDSGKFIPIDARTDEPHNCNGQISDVGYFPDEIKRIITKSIEPVIVDNKITLSESVQFDITKIPKLEIIMMV